MMKDRKVSQPNITTVTPARGARVRGMRLGVLGLLGAGLLAACSSSEPPAGRARVYSAGPGQVLTAPSQAAPAAVVAGFLRDLGVGPAADHLRIVRESQRPRAGLLHLRMRQEVGGLRVVGAYVKATLTERGELVHVIEKLAPVPAQGIAAPRASEREALAAALQHLGYELSTLPAETRRDGNTVTFERGEVFYSEPTVERVAFAGPGGHLRAGFLVETWSLKGNLLHHTLVAGSGQIVSVELRTATDKYNVFVEDPLKGPQTVVDGPGAGNAESPVGWLGTAAQTTINISGNNANAYLDADGNNRADRGGASVTNGQFLTAVDLSPGAVDRRQPRSCRAEPFLCDERRPRRPLLARLRRGGWQLPARQLRQGWRGR
jgi:hypothetical protein